MEPTNDSLDDKKLVDEALSLIVTLHELPDQVKRQQFADWESRSSAHSTAMQKAQESWALMGLMEEPSASQNAVLQSVRDAAPLTTRDPSRPVLFGSALAISFLVIFGIWFSVSDEIDPTPVSIQSIVTEHYRSRHGQMEFVQLSDGSSLWLDWDTAVSAKLTTRERSLTLQRGKVRILVAEDSDRPFTVHVDGVSAVAIGTEFVVNRIDTDLIEVAVLEGVVGITGESQYDPTQLRSAEAVRVTAGEPGEVTLRPIREIGSWRDGVLIFEGRPLVDVLAVLEPYSSFTLDTSGILDPNRSVSGSFLVEKADSAIRALMQTYGLEVHRQVENRLVLRSSPTRQSERL
ncbi:MAG: FecR domain-containing protein [Pseudomonadota bacterium]